MTKAPSHRIWGYIFAGCITSTIIRAMGPIEKLSILIAVSLMLWMCCQQYRSHHSTQFFRGLQFLLGMSLPLTGFVEPPEANVNTQGRMVRITKIQHRDHLHVVRGLSNDNVMVQTYIQKGKKTPSVGQMAWLSGPCKTSKQLQNFSSWVKPKRIYCRGPVYVAPSSSSPSWWRRIKAHFIEALNTQTNVNARALMKAMTLGDKSELSGQLMDLFTDVGANHLLAISGLHVAGMAGLFYSIILAFLAFWGWAHAKTLAIICSCCLAYFMLLIADGPVGAVRAFITYTAVGVMLILGRKTDSIEILFLAATAMVLDTPTIWLQAGFQFSFISVLSIIWLVDRNSVWVQAMYVTGWSTIATAPLCTYYFGTVSPSGLLTNLLLVPLTTFILMPSLWIGLCLSPLSDIVLKISGEATLYTLAVLKQLRELGCQMWVIGSENTLAVTLLCLALCLMKFHRKMSVLLLVAGLTSWHRMPADSVHFMSVGQGDATIVQSHGKTALLDAGPGSSGESLLRACRRLGISSIDLLVISHQHPDHFEGLATLVGRIPITTVLVPKRPRSNQRLMQIQRSLLAHGTHIKQLDKKTLNLGAFTLNLYLPDQYKGRSENDASIAVHVSHSEGDIMVMGDLEKKGEAHLIEHNVPQVDIVRGGHHGSKTSSHLAILSTLCPSHVVLSLGYQNRFGFPHRETIRRIRRQGASLWRTDIDGRITVNFQNGFEISAVNHHPVSGEHAHANQRCYPPLSMERN